MKITYADSAKHSIRSVVDDIAKFRSALFGRHTRAERGLEPYVSPKKRWDQHGDLGVTVDVLEAKEPSTRHMRRVRQRDLAAMGRKSRRSAAKNRFDVRQAEQSLRGQARVYLDGAGTPAMRETVRREIHGLATKVAAEQGEEFATALKRVEGSLMEIQATYGDDL